jgi:hypothetical protein
MEVRSSRRMRNLVTQMVRSGLSGNENAGALISMMSPEHDAPIKGRIH